MASTPVLVLRRVDLEKKLGLSRSSLYAKFRPNPKRPGDFDPSFPQPIPLGAKAVGWLSHEVDAWLAAQAARRDEALR